jgi:multiple sugar transport system permease protein
MLDAARVDGASEFRIFVQIVLPVIKPILVTLATFTFLSSWNDFMWPLIILSDSAKYTLPVALANLVGEHALDTELMMAGSVLTVLPALVVFLVFQRSYVRGIMAGSVKG